MSDNKQPQPRAAMPRDFERSAKILKSYKNRYKGRRCFIIGNGPSLRAADLDKIKASGGFSFGSNRIYMIFPQTEWRPDVFTASDPCGIKMSVREMSAIEAKLKIIPLQVEREMYPIRGALPVHYLFNDNNWILKNEAPLFSEDILSIQNGQTITYANMQIAAYLGFKEMVLIGMDHIYARQWRKPEGDEKPEGAFGKIRVNEGVQNHFCANYADDLFDGRGDSMLAQCVEHTTLAFESAKKYAAAHGIRIVNATRGGYLEVFERVDFDSLFDGNQPRPLPHTETIAMNAPASEPQPEKPQEIKPAPSHEERAGRGLANSAKCACCASEEFSPTGIRDKYFDTEFARCSRCGHIQLARFPGDLELEEFYKKYSAARTLDAAQIEYFAQRAEAQFDFVAKYIGDGLNAQTRVCELGCGYGYLLKAFEIITKNLRGVEADEKCLQHAKELGLEATPPPQEWRELGGCDLVLMSHFLERERCPTDLLQALFQNECAFVFIEVPNQPCLYEGIQGPGDIHCFSRSSLAVLMSANGYDILAAGLYGCDAKNFRTSDRSKNYFDLESKQGVWLRLLAKRLEVPQRCATAARADEQAAQPQSSPMTPSEDLVSASSPSSPAAPAEENAQTVTNSPVEIAEVGCSRMGDTVMNSAKCVCCASEEFSATGVLCEDFDTEFVRCHRCGHVQPARFPGALELEEFYKKYSVSRTLDAARIKFLSRKGESQFDFVAKYTGGGLNAQTRVCELGCGYGYLLKAFEKITKNLRGVEADEKCLQHAKELGLEATPPPREWRELGGYDLVLMSHFLERERCPADLLQALFQNECAFVFIETPSQSCFYEGRRAPGHIHYFSRDSLAALMGANGYDVLSVGAYGYDADSFMTRERNTNFFELENERGIYLRVLAKRQEAPRLGAARTDEQAAQPQDSLTTPEDLSASAAPVSASSQGGPAAPAEENAQTVMNRPVVIAEVGCNHMGDMSIAHKMIQILGTMRLFSEDSAIDVVKFQKRENRELLSPAEYDAPHPVPANSYGKTYGEHREALEFDLGQHRQLKEWCEEAGCEYSTSVWELTSARKIASLSPRLIKVPSASNLDFEMLGWLAAEYGGEIHVSLGMTTREEEDRIVAFLDGKGRARDTVLYACTSGYPVPFEDLCLREITRLREKFGATVKAIGFSGHHLGIAADVAALTLGAEYFERHFTLDRTWKGTDHAASLEPEGMRKLARNLRGTAQALTYKSKEILDIEEVQRKKLKRKL